MPARIRDAIAVAVLVLTVLGAVLAWHPLGRWTALVISLAGLLIAAGVYRARRPAFPLIDVNDPSVTEEPVGEPDAAASTRRPS